MTFSFLGVGTFDPVNLAPPLPAVCGRQWAGDRTGWVSCPIFPFAVTHLMVAPVVMPRRIAENKSRRRPRQLSGCFEVIMAECRARIGHFLLLSFCVGDRFHCRKACGIRLGWKGDIAQLRGRAMAFGLDGWWPGEPLSFSAS